MTLTTEDRETIAAWIKDKCGQLRCTACGFAQWTLVDVATLPIGFDLHSTRFYYHQGIPQVSIVCTNCGNTLFFNTGVMGFKPDQPKPVELPLGKAQ